LKLTRCYPRHFTFHVADPISSVRAVTTGSGIEPRSSTGCARTLATRISDHMIVNSCIISGL
jgi:hypothetical protein